MDNNHNIVSTPQLKAGSNQKAGSHSLSTDLASTPMTNHRKAADRDGEEDDEADRMDCNSLQGVG